MLFSDPSIQLQETYPGEIFVYILAKLQFNDTANNSVNSNNCNCKTKIHLKVHQ
jgi:hypothetical protein